MTSILVPQFILTITHFAFTYEYIYKGDLPLLRGEGLRAVASLLANEYAKERGNN